MQFLQENHNFSLQIFLCLQGLKQAIKVNYVILVSSLLKKRMYELQIKLDILILEAIL